MAVDSRAKRFSILGFNNIWQSPIITPDGTVDQSDRQHLLRGYSGILWAASTVSAIDTFLFNSYIELTMSLKSYIETAKSISTHIETTNTFTSEVK